ncbi:phosphotransferase family protein [Gordonia sp. NPDC003425]
MELDGRIIAWIEDVTNASVVRIERQGRWRPQFFVDVEGADGTVEPLLVRLVRDPDLVPLSAFLSHFDLAHESRVLDALQDGPVRVPKTYGFFEDPPAILMQRVAGSNEFDDVPDEARAAVMRDYVENLYRLHTIPVDADLIDRLGLTLPATPEELAFAQIGFVERDFRTAAPFIGPEPLLEFALWWLKDNVPANRTAVSWVQGDTGPGQFMVDDGELTALIDWELSHLGDPLLDLGVLRMRSMIYPAGDVRSYLEHYESLAGGDLDRDALCFYTVLAMLLSPLGMSALIQNPTAAVQSMLPMLGWDVTLRRGLCDSLCEVYGIDVEEPTLPGLPPPGRTDLPHYLVDHLATHCEGIGRDTHDRMQIDGALGLARSVEMIVALGPSLDSDDLDDMSQVIGHRPADRNDGLTALVDIVTNDPRDRLVDLIRLFSRMERRREYLWRPLMTAQHSQPFEVLYPTHPTHS